MPTLQQTFRPFQQKTPLELFLLGSWWVILALMPFHAFLSTWGGSTIGPLEVWKSWKEILLLVSLFASLGYLLQQKQLKAYLADPLVWLIFAYAGLHIVLWVVFRPERSPALAGLLMNLRFLGMILLTWVVLIFVPPRELLKLALATILAGGVGVIVFALLQSTVLPHDFLRHFGYGKDTIAPATTLDNNQNIIRLQSTLRGPNPLGAYLIMISLLLAGVWRRNHRAILASLLIATIFVVVFTYSRSAWVGMVVATVAFIYLQLNNAKLRRNVLIVAACCSVIGGIGLAAALPHSTFLQNTVLHNKIGDSDRGSTEEHATALTNASDQIIHHPFGQGPGSAGPASFYGSQPNIPENYYLQIAEEIGVLGLLLFLAVNAVVVWRLWQQRQRKWAAVWLAAFAGLAIVNIFLQGWADETTAIVWWTVAAILIWPQRQAD